MITVLSRDTVENQIVLGVRFSVPGRPDELHRVWITSDAIKSRLVFYGIEDEEQAIEAILREHYCRLIGKDQSPPKHDISVGSSALKQAMSWLDIEPSERGRITGGLDHSIEIRRS